MSLDGIFEQDSIEVVDRNADFKIVMIQTELFAKARINNQY